MLGVARGPQAEPVMMLAREDQGLHAAMLRRLDDLIGIEGGRIEDLRRLVAVAPLAVGECIDGEMQKPVELERVPGQLPGARDWGIGAGSIGDLLASRMPVAAVPRGGRENKAPTNAEACIL